MNGQRAELLGRRFPAALLMGGLAVSFVFAAVVTVGHWTPGGLITHDLYNWAFTIHGVPALLLLPAVALFLGELEGSRTGGPGWLVPAAWGALGLEAAALAARLVLGDCPILQSWTGLALFPACALVAAAVLLRRPRPMRARDAMLVLVSFVQLVGLGLAVPLDLAKVLDPYLHPTLSSAGHGLTAWTFEATALAAVAVAVGDLPGKRGPWVPLLLLLAATLVPSDNLYQLASTPAASVGAFWLAAFALRGGELRSTGERLFAALAALTFLESATLGQLLRLMGVDAHLDDTYFVVGLFHLRAATCVLAVLAVLLRHRQPSGPKLLLYSAATLSAVGSQLMGFSMMVVGARGMPRRYFNYLPEFEPLHRAIAVAGGLFMLGVLLVLFGLWRSTFRYGAEAPLRSAASHPTA
jgi:hypothetical protein